MKDHVVIVGYGLNGRNLARVLRKVGVPYLVIEMNPETVARERRLGTSIVYGDASSRDILELAQVRAARVLVVVVSDPPAIRRIVWTARQLHPGLHIIVRTRFVGEVQPLLDLGADEVVPEEFETSLEIFSRTLRHLLVPRDTVERFVFEARADAYGILRGAWEPARGAAAVSGLVGVQMEVLRVEEGSALAGKTLRESGLRQETGASVLALKSGDRFLPNPPTEATLEPGAVAIVFGSPEQVAKAAALFRAPLLESEGTPGS